MSQSSDSRCDTTPSEMTSSPLRPSFKAWVEAMRLRTLPVSVAGVVAGCACAVHYCSLQLWPAAICLVFAVLAQISSNFANEYFDFRQGLDRRGREGFRRGVTEGDITPRAMLAATLGTLALACCLGVSLVIWGGWWLIAAGALIAAGVLAYSAGPYPLSHHGLGEVAVIFFYGLVPVMLTAWIQYPVSESLPFTSAMGLAVGLMGANVMIVNNYRDADDDRLAGKHTTSVIFGRKAISWVYLLDSLVAAALIVCLTARSTGWWWQAGTFVYFAASAAIWRSLRRNRGSALNPLLGKTAMLMAVMAVWIFVMLSAGGRAV